MTGSLTLLFAMTSLLTADASPLDQYVQSPDSAYQWTISKTIPGRDHVTYLVEMTSQRWRSEKEVDKPLWKHRLVIVKPHILKGNTALLFIGGGENTQPMPEGPSDRVLPMVRASGTIIAELYDVPSQPLRFADSPDVSRVEDDIIAYSRVKYFETRDPNWLARLPMVKSAVRAMDAVTEIMAKEASETVDGFVVAGASKRGWTTWLTAAVDPRVKAIVPIVIDALNSQEITKHHFEAYGFFSPALNDYVRHGLFPNKIGTPEYAEVLAIEDPYHYRNRERMKMPKYLVNAAGDEFFLPDNWQFYYPDLPEEKHLRYVPNAKHNLEGSDAGPSILAFHRMVVENRPRPKYSWKKLPDGGLEIVVTDKPKQVKLWQALNIEARDFRLDTIKDAWISEPIEPAEPNVYRAKLEGPAKGYTAYFVELTFDVGSVVAFKVSTGVCVVPDVLPFQWEDAMKEKTPPKTIK